MEIAFETQQLRTLCEHASKATKEWGITAADALRSRLADLIVADSVYDVPGSKWEQMDDPRDLLISLNGGLKLVVRCNQANPPMAGANLDWRVITRIKVMEIRQGA